MSAPLGRHLAAALKVWRAQRVQAALAGLGVVAGLAGLMLVLAIGAGARREMEQSLGRLGAGTMLVRSPPSVPAAGRIAREREHALGRLLGAGLGLRVPVRVRQQPVGVPGARHEDVRVISTTGDYAAAFRLRLHSGRFISAFDVERERSVCVLGWDLGRLLMREGARLGADVQVGGQVCRLVGLLAPAGTGSAMPALDLPDFDSAAFLPLTAGGDDAHFDELLLGFRSEQELLRAVGAVRRILEYGRAQPIYEYLIPVELMRQKLRIREVMGYLLGGLTIVMLLVGGIGITNMMLVNVLRRRPEIGLRLAVGATRRDVITQFMVESALIAAVGGLAGIVLGILAAFGAGGLLGWSVAVPLWSVPLAFAVSLLLGAACGGYPALQAASVEPIRTLNQG